MTPREWSAWLMENYGNYPMVGDGQIEYLKKQVKATTTDIARQKPYDDSGLMIDAGSLIEELWSVVHEVFDFSKECDAERAVTRELLAARLAKIVAFPVKPNKLDEVRSWVRQELSTAEWNAYGHAAYVVIGDEVEQVLFKLRWMDELQLK